MKKYYVSETQNLNSYSKPDVVYANNLTEAKRKASFNHAFHGTVLKIYYNSITNLVAYKEDGIWTDL